MEFLLPIQMLTASQLNTIVHKYDQISKLAGELGFHPVKGMLKGLLIWYLNAKESSMFSTGNLII